MWTILCEAGRNRRRQRLVRARCVCGNERVLTEDNIKRGCSKSCGCLNRPHEHAKSRGGKPSRTYVSWQSMRTRCLNPNSSDFPNYGGRGITIVAKWDDFLEFLADMGERPDGMTLDRINVNGPYSPDNCQWATYKHQRANQRPHKRSVQ